MKEKIVVFPLFFACMTRINNDDLLRSKVVHSEDFTMRKLNNLSRHFHIQISLKGKSPYYLHVKPHRNYLKIKKIKESKAP